MVTGQLLNILVYTIYFIVLAFGTLSTSVVYIKTEGLITFVCIKTVQHHSTRIRLTNVVCRELRLSAPALKVSFKYTVGVSDLFAQLFRVNPQYTHKRPHTVC